MALKEKVIGLLTESLQPEYIRLEDDDGISGFIVSRRFKGMSTLDRQEKIEEALQRGLGSDERRRVQMVAGLTPQEYEGAGSHIRIHRVRAIPGGVEVVLHGSYSDAEYVRAALSDQKGIETTDPQPVSGAQGALMKFKAKGSPANPLSKERAMQVLKGDQYVEVMANA